MGMTDFSAPFRKPSQLIFLSDAALVVFVGESPKVNSDMFSHSC